MALPTVFWHDDPSSQRLKEAIGTLAQALGTPLRIIPGYLVLVETPEALPAAQAAPQLFVAQASTVTPPALTATETLPPVTVSAETPLALAATETLPPATVTPPAATRTCEICGAPVGGRWKVCTSPVCQQERKRRYAMKYYQARNAGALSTVTPPALAATETLSPATVSAETPLAATRTCEVCGVPVGGHRKVCASPVCQQERKRRYAMKYHHARNAGTLSTVTPPALIATETLSPATVSAETPLALAATETLSPATVSAETPLALAAETEVGVRPAPFELDWPLAACCRVESGELAGQHHGLGAAPAPGQPQSGGGDDAAAARRETRQGRISAGHRGAYAGRLSGDSLPEEQRRCVLCGKRYAACECVCPCGVKKWRRTENGWLHHVCAGGRR